MVVKAKMVASAWAKTDGVRQAGQGNLEQAGQGLFADPAEGEAGHGDADLNAVENLVQLVVELADGARADASLLR